MIWYCNKMWIILVTSVWCRNIQKIMKIEHPWRDLLCGCKSNPDIGNNFVGSGCLINLVFRFLSHDVSHIDHMIVQWSWWDHWWVRWEYVSVMSDDVILRSEWHTKTHAGRNRCHSERDCHWSTITQLWNANLSTSSNHTKASVQCCHCKHTVVSLRTLLSEHVKRLQIVL
jgi:hypothetical protein